MEDATALAIAAKTKVKPNNKFKPVERSLRPRSASADASAPRHGWPKLKPRRRQAEIELILALQAKANTDVLAPQATVQAVIIIKQEALAICLDAPSFGLLQGDIWEQILHLDPLFEGDQEVS
jgi:hypothetical protein